MLATLLALIKGKKTYLAGAFLALVQVLHTQGYITDKGETTLSWLATAGGLIALRAAVKTVAIQAGEAALVKYLQSQLAGGQADGQHRN